MNNTIKIGTVGFDGMTAGTFAALLETCTPDEPLYIDFHSEGGAVFEGFGIYNQLKEWPGKKIARIKAAAFSIASYIAMACDEIQIADNGFFMIHNPWTQTEGDDDDHAKNAALLAELKQSMVAAYASRTGMAAEDVQSLMKEETYIGAVRAIELGLADSVIEPVPPAAQFKNQLPQAVFAAMYGGRGSGNKKESEKEFEMSQTPTKVAATVKEIKAAFPNAKSDFVIRCMEEEMTLEEVGESRAKAMEEENEELMAKIAAMEEEKQEIAAKLAAMEEEMAAIKSAEETEEEPVARRSGSAPIPQGAAAGSRDPRAEWTALVASYKAKGMTGIKAVQAANRQNPGLRERMLEEVNA